LPISTVVSLWIFRNHSPAHASYLQAVPLAFLDECHLPLKHLKRLSPQLGLTHWIPDTQITVETDASDYALTADLSITTPNGDLNPIASHSWTFSALELNYDVHDKELLAILKLCKRWYIPQSSGLPIDVVTDHWNLQYFSTTKIITWRQHVGPIPFQIQSRNPFPSW